MGQNLPIRVDDCTSALALFASNWDDHRLLRDAQAAIPFSPMRRSNLDMIILQPARAASGWASIAGIDFGLWSGAPSSRRVMQPCARRSSLSSTPTGEFA